MVLEDKNILKVSVQKGGRVYVKWLSHINKKLQLDVESTSSFKHLFLVLQVIHDCRSISDCLSHQYRIILSNVFDTQVPCWVVWFVTRV